MKVLMFGWEFPPHISGGLGTACYGLTKSMSAQGCDIIFVVPKAYGDEDDSFLKITNASNIKTDYLTLSKNTLYDTLRIIQIDSNLVPYSSPEEFYNQSLVQKKRTVYSEYSLWESRYNFSGKYGSNLMEEVRRYAIVASQVAKDLAGQFDIIHAHDWLTYYAGIAAKEISGKPLVIHVHATEFDRSGDDNINTQVYEIEQTGMQRADKICAVSNLTRNIIINKYHISSDKICTVHNGITFKDKVSSYERNIPDKIVTFLGRVTYQKGPDYFVEAAYKVLDMLPNVRFVMAGSGDMLNKIIKRVAQLGISDRFHFTGFLEGSDVEKMFSMSDIYIMPSVSEPFGISPLEAMRAGVPVIISKQSGVAEVIKNAVKVDYWDVDELANAIYALLQYPTLPTMMREQGDKEIPYITWDNAASQIKQIYNSLIS